MGESVFCTSCGNKCSSEDKFCGRCGKKLNNDLEKDIKKDIEKVTVNGVGKKIVIDGNNIIVSKTIGKTLKISIDNISDISYEKGTMSRNGYIHIKWIDTNYKEQKEDIMFRCFSNDIVSEITDKISRYLNDPNNIIDIKNKEKTGFFKQLNMETTEQFKLQAEEKLKGKERLLELKNQGIPYCPKCHSTSLTTTNKKLSVGRAVVGGALIGGTGAILGGLTSKKIELVCMNCGHKFKPGKK